MITQLIGTERFLSNCAGILLLQYCKEGKYYPEEEYCVPHIRLAKMIRKQLRQNGRRNGIFKLFSELTGESVEF